MAIEVTDEAVEVLRRSLELAGSEPPAGVRLRAATALGGGVDVQVELADGPLEGETVIDRDGVNLFIDPSLTAVMPEAIVTVEPQHERVIVRPAG
ncbi:MAG: hypothetical protein M3345_04865 [Actinomycetota bacterium]|nr:hypothetical protein [Actinomycetota bacterium]